MGIEMETRVGKRGEVRAGVSVFCDACDERLADGRQANYLWQWQKEGGARTKIYFAHKGDCTRRIEAALSVNHLHWESLNDMPIRLAANLRLDVKKKLPVPLGAIIDASWPK